MALTKAKENSCKPARTSRACSKRVRCSQCDYSLCASLSLCFVLTVCLLSLCFFVAAHCYLSPLSALPENSWHLTTAGRLLSHPLKPCCGVRGLRHFRSSAFALWVRKQQVHTHVIAYGLHITHWEQRKTRRIHAFTCLLNHTSNTASKQQTAAELMCAFNF